MKPMLIHCRYDARFYHHVMEFEIPNETGTAVLYNVRVNHVDFTEKKEKFIRIVADTIQKVIHPVIEQCYDLTEKREDALDFYLNLTVEPDWKNWTLSSVKVGQKLVDVQITKTNAILTYDVYTHVRKPSILRFEKDYADGSSVCIKVGAKRCMDDKYLITYRYVKPVKKTPNAILEGIEDIVLFHYGHMMS